MRNLIVSTTVTENRILTGIRTFMRTEIQAQGPETGAAPSGKKRIALSSNVCADVRLYKFTGWKGACL